MAEAGGDEVEHRLQPVAHDGGVGGVAVQTREPEPPGAPLQLPDRRPDVLLAPGRHVDGDDAVQLAVHLDGLSDVEPRAPDRLDLVVRPDRNDHGLPLPQRALGRLRQVGPAAMPLGPERRGGEAIGPGALEHEDPAGDARDHAALQGQPRPDERLGARRLTELPPQQVVGIGRGVDPSASE